MMDDVRYEVKDMAQWAGVDADLLMTDIPFGIDFDSDRQTYNRDEKNVSEGYVEWSEEGYKAKVDLLLSTAFTNLKTDGQVLIFSGADNSHLVRQAIEQSEFTFQGKLYWAYNFAPYCKKRPAHNVYEIYWATKSDEWYYDNECSESHCSRGEANLSMMEVKREFRPEKLSYPTQLPQQVVRVLLEHYTEEGDLVFDPLAGSGVVGLMAGQMGREAVLGDKNEEAKQVFEVMTDEITEDAQSVLDWGGADG